MSSPLFPLSGEQKNAYHQLVEAPPTAPDYARTGAANPRLRVFMAHFDGTRNNRLDIPPDEQKTLVAESFEHFRACGDSAIEPRYYAGVGTTSDLVDRAFESVTGEGCKHNAEAAYLEFAKQVVAWRKQDPDCEVHVHAVGFSRGAATAVDFLNMVHAQGAWHPTFAQSPELQHQDVSLPGPREVLSSAVIFDCVSTGQNDKLELTIPASCVAAVHLIAGGEQRLAFPLREIADTPEHEVAFARGVRMEDAAVRHGAIKYSRVQRVVLPAARHSDVGGAYPDGGIREVSAFLSAHFQASLGLPAVVVKPPFSYIQKCHFHDSDWVKLTRDAQYLQEAERVCKPAQKLVWDGAWVAETKIEGLALDQVLVQSGQADARKSHKLGKNIGKTLQACLRLPYDDELPDAPAGVVLEGGDDILAIKGGLLCINGEAIRGLPPVEAIRGHLMSQLKGSRMELVEPVRIDVDVKRNGGIFNARQDPKAPAPARLVYPPDPWPITVRRAISEMNASNNPSRERVNRLVAQAMLTVIKTLHREGLAQGEVTLTPQRHRHVTDSGVRQRNTFELTYTPRPVKTAQDGLKAQAIKRQLAAKSRCDELVRSLEALADVMREKGFVLTPGVGLTIDPAKPPHEEDLFANRVVEGGAAVSMDIYKLPTAILGLLGATVGSATPVPRKAPAAARKLGTSRAKFG